MFPRNTKLRNYNNTWYETTNQQTNGFLSSELLRSPFSPFYCSVLWSSTALHWKISLSLIPSNLSQERDCSSKGVNFSKASQHRSNEQTEQKLTWLDCRMNMYVILCHIIPHSSCNSSTACPADNRRVKGAHVGVTFPVALGGGWERMDDGKIRDECWTMLSCHSDSVMKWDFFGTDFGSGARTLNAPPIIVRTW